MSDETENGHDEPLLSAKEIEDIRKKARAEILAEKKKAFAKSVLEEEKRRLQLEEGLVTGNAAADQIVDITIDLPEFCTCLKTNFDKQYWHGQTYTVPRHVAEDLRWRIQMAWHHENEINGKSLANFYQSARQTKLSAVAGAKNAPSRPDQEVRV